MSDVQLTEVSKVYEGGTVAVSSVDLEVESGELVVLVGPSGCGKSSILRMIAGLEEISGGDILIGGERVNDLSPSQRNIAMVFQNYALYPHMTVRKNMGFSLRLKRVETSERERRVEDTAGPLGLLDLLERLPAQLSGGQRQRVAMGRAMVRAPKVFLLDEPLSNLDAKLRTQMRSEIRELQRRLGATMMFVTHDQVEAMTMADRIVVMRRGILQQVGTPRDLYRRPANLFVADFIGSPAMNLVRGRLTRDATTLGLAYGDGLSLTIPSAFAEGPGRSSDLDGREVILGVRPEHLRVLPFGDPGGIPARARFQEILGDETLIHLDVPAPPVVTEELRDIAQDVDETTLDLLEDAKESRFVVKVTGEITVEQNSLLRVGLREDAQLYLFDPMVPSVPSLRLGTEESS